MPTDERQTADALADILSRLRKDRDFPGMSEHIQSICRLAGGDGDVSVSDLANEILKDFAVTNKLLKLVNSAYYGQFQEEISTVSRAVAVLGFEQVRNAALSLMLFENLKRRGGLPELIDATNTALFSGLVGGRIAGRVAPEVVEETRICSMFHELGRLLVMFYLPDRYREITDTLRKTTLSPRQAARRVLGVAYEEIGVGVGRVWNFPETLLQSMREPPPGPAPRPGSPEETLHLVAVLSSKLSHAASEQDSDDAPAIAERFGKALGLGVETLHAVVHEAVDEAVNGKGLITIGRSGNALLQRARRWTGDVMMSDGTPDGDTPCPESSAPVSSSQAIRPSRPDPRDILLAGLQEVTRTLLSPHSIDDVIRIILETGYRAAGFSHFLFCVRDTHRPVMIARFGFGGEIDRFKNEFAVPIGSGQDSVFADAVDEGRDVYVDDTSATESKNRIPPWHRTLVPARSIVLLPVRAGAVSIGLFYGDTLKSDTETTAIPDFLPHLKTLRDQAILAITSRRS